MKQGKIPTCGGLLNPAEADEARRRNLRHDGRTKETDLDPRLELAAHVGRFAIGNELRERERLLTLAETALGLGCTLEQSICIATWYSTLVAVWCFDDDEASELEEQQAPDWQLLARRIGGSISAAEVKAAIKRGVLAVSKWDAKHPRPKGAKQ